MTTVTDVGARDDVLVGDEQAGGVDAEAGAAAAAVLDVDRGRLAQLAPVGAGEGFLARPDGPDKGGGRYNPQESNGETHGEIPRWRRGG